VDYKDVVRSWQRVRRMEPLRLSEMLHGLEGKWVALKDGKVIAAADQAELVGLG
jgi:hypothetical protein